MRYYGLSTLETIVADFGDNLSPKTATVAEFGDYSQSLVANVDRPLSVIVEKQPRCPASFNWLGAMFPGMDDGQRGICPLERQRLIRLLLCFIRTSYHTGMW